jgi:7-carboxy-7-deazaguanine synthase
VAGALVKAYPLAEPGVFWTIQGEGALMGEPMAFIRLAGCSVVCAQCDTDYRVTRRVQVSDLVREVQAVTPSQHSRPWVWITGGEPTDHDLVPLIVQLRAAGYHVALATSGVRQAPLVDWLSVSPHTVDAAQRTGHELKVVPGLNGLTWADVETFARWSFPYRYMQPIWYRTINGPEMDGAESHKSMLECLAFVKAHPGWRLGIQSHKYWNVP